MKTRPAVSPRPQAPGRAPRGYFDLQVNGFAGVDFQQSKLTARDLARAVAGLHRHGTTRILLTLITDRMDRLAAKLANIDAILRRYPELARTIVGCHLEGPWLLPEKGYHGAHNPRWMHAPRLAEFERLSAAAGGRIRLVTLAPEWPGSPDFIRHLVARGMRVAIGHSNASADQIDAAIAAGLTLCTHLGNGVPLQLDRHENVVQRLLARDELFAAFIPDLIHLPRNVLQNFVRAKPRHKVLFTTDAMAAAGAGPGRYRIAHMVTEVGADGVVRQPGETRYFAGSSLTMDVAAAHVRTLPGWSAAQARAACSTRVAAYLGL